MNSCSYVYINQMYRQNWASTGANCDQYMCTMCTTSSVCEYTCEDPTWRSCLSLHESKHTSLSNLVTPYNKLKIPSLSDETIFTDVACTLGEIQFINIFFAVLVCVNNDANLVEWSFSNGLQTRAHDHFIITVAPSSIPMGLINFVKKNNDGKQILTFETRRCKPLLLFIKLIRKTFTLHAVIEWYAMQCTCSCPCTCTVLANNEYPPLKINFLVDGYWQVDAVCGT
jgi:hypothetical protein